MIKKIKEEILSWQNHFWIKKHEDELYEKYDGHWIAVRDCKVVAVGNSLYEMPEMDGTGVLCYQVPINLDKLAEKHGFKIGLRNE
nr:MAG TPA: hypothetical protein [Bacteriophage sp.]